MDRYVEFEELRGKQATVNGDRCQIIRVYFDESLSSLLVITMSSNNGFKTYRIATYADDSKFVILE